MIISGGTGSGKTTLLNALSAFIPDDERVATIEDAAELRLQQPHVVRMETRPANIEGEGEVTTRDLVRNALRMRPDRIIIGECRGPEALDMLQAMNTGHDGSMTTIHANDTRDAISRLEMMVGMAGFDLPIWIIRRQIASAVQIIVQVARLPGGVRKVIKISEITGMEGDVISMHDIFVFKQTGVDEHRVAQGYFFVHRHPAPVPGAAGGLGQPAVRRDVRAADPQCLSRSPVVLSFDPVVRLRVLTLARPRTMNERMNDMTPALLPVLTFVAAVAAVLGIYSIVSDLYLRDRSRVSSGSTTSSASGCETGPRSRCCSRTSASSWPTRDRRRGAADPAPRFEAMVEQSGLDLTPPGC